MGIAKLIKKDLQDIKLIDKLVKDGYLKKEQIMDTKDIMDENIAAVSLGNYSLTNVPEIGVTVWTYNFVTNSISQTSWEDNHKGMKIKLASGLVWKTEEEARTAINTLLKVSLDRIKPGDFDTSDEEKDHQDYLDNLSSKERDTY